MNEQIRLSSSENEQSTRVKVNSWKKTVGITLPEDLIERARNQGLNISKVTENAPASILDYLQVQNAKPVLDETSSKKFQWTGRDLNPRLPHCECGVHTRLNYRPDFL
jgi:post-segregation antitoxin (ccd killing protein)